MEIMIKQGLSDQVRTVASEKYVRAAVRAGQGEFSIPVKDMQGYLRAEGFPENHVPQICTALQSQKFLKEHGLRIVRIDGPRSKMSTTVVITYRLESSLPYVAPRTSRPLSSEPAVETPKARMRRLAESLRGLLKEEFAPYGGGEAFLRWVRDEDAQ